jgi:uncharacterized RDD family membrane protein YckC
MTTPNPWQSHQAILRLLQSRSDLPKTSLIRRAIAHWIDGVFVAFLSFALTTALILAGIPQNRAAIAFFVSAPVLGVLYAGWLLSGPRRATVGKHIMGLEVLTLGGVPVSFLTGAGHQLAMTLSLALMFPVAVLVALLRRDGRGLHELVMNTVTLRRGVIAAPAAASPPAQTRTTRPAWGKLASTPSPASGRREARKKEMPPAPSKSSTVVERRKR